MVALKSAWIGYMRPLGGEREIFSWGDARAGALIIAISGEQRGLPIVWLIVSGGGCRLILYPNKSFHFFAKFPSY